MFKEWIARIKYRRDRKRQAARATSLAVQLVLNGHLTPTRLTGAKGREMRLSPPVFQAFISPGGVA